MIVVTDLDGTLLRSDGTFNRSDIAMLQELGERGVVRAIATGRSPFSASKVIPVDFPIDYLIFSSGAGVIGWHRKEIVHTNELAEETVRDIVNLLISEGVSFMVHEPIPFNHHFQYCRGESVVPDFDRRVNLYSDCCSPLIAGIPYQTAASQLLVVLPPASDKFVQLKANIERKGVKVIRATSPIDGESIWVEIFPSGVSKASGIEWVISDMPSVTEPMVVAVGNDYNDLDMLLAADRAFVVGNSPDELKHRFEVTRTNDQAGFAHAIRSILRG